MSQTEKQTDIDIVKTAQVLMHTLSGSHRRGQQWDPDKPSPIPWHERAAMTCAKAAIAYYHENRQLRARVATLEKALAQEGRGIP